MTALWTEHVYTLEIEFEENKILINTAERQFPGNPGGPHPPQDHQTREGLRSGGSPEHVTDDENNKHTTHGRILENYGQRGSSNYQNIPINRQHSMQHGQYNQQYPLHIDNTCINMHQKLQNISCNPQQSGPYNMHIPKGHNYGQQFIQH